jgi:type IV pilus assembly protein PilQ
MKKLHRKMIVTVLAGLALSLVGLSRAAQNREIGPDSPPAASQPAAIDVPAAPAPSSPEVTKDPEGKLQLHVRDLDIVSLLTQLRMKEKRNIVISNKVSGRISIDLYGVTFEEALNAIMRAGNLTARTEGAFIYVQTPEEAGKSFDPEKKLTSCVFHLFYAGASEVIKLLKTMSSPDGSLATTSTVEKGIQANSEQAGGNDFAAPDTIVVVDYPENIARMKYVVAKVDTRPQEVLIEATILSATLTDDNALGVDFTSLCGIDFEKMSAVSPGGNSITLGDMPAQQLNNSTLSSNTNFINTLPQDGLNIGFIRNNVGVFIHALEQVMDTTVLANPKVLVLNKQRGQVMVGRRDGYKTSISTETTTIQNVEFLETGTRLIFRPFIGNDGYIRLEVHPEDSSGGINDQGLPFKETAEVTTNIMVKDGMTIVIGGLFRDKTSMKRGQLPILGNIPGLGAAFRRTRDEATKQEVIILLTPHIVENPADERYSDKLMADTETIRVGMRQGLQWFGRDRLAQAAYRAAVKYYNKGERSKALWELNSALNLNPGFLDAIRLREELLGEPLEEPTGSAIKDLILTQVLPAKECPRDNIEKGTPCRP